MSVVVATGSQLSLHFSLQLDNGDIVDSTFEKSPVQLVVGDGNLPAGFEKHLLGLSAGSHERFAIAPEDAFGQLNESNLQVISRSQFAPDMELSEGLVVSFSDKSGQELPGVISEWDENTVTVDFNHPLAGKPLTFEVKILSVEAAA